MSLQSLFESLPVPIPERNQGQCFSAQPIPRYENHRIGKDVQGCPALLISAKDAAFHVQLAPTVLENLTVQHDLDCRVSRPNLPPEEGRFSVVRCTGDDRALVDYFLRLAEPLAASLGSSPSQSDVTHTIDTLVELFRAMAEPPRKAVQGLWAELLLIARSRDPVVLVEAWHTMPEDRYDFGSANQRIEVKSTAGRVRRHHFSLEQLHPSDGTNLLIASVFVERSGGGYSAKELRDEVQSKINLRPDLLLRVDRITGLTLGENWRSASEERFDRKLAEESLAFFEPNCVPSVDPNLPIGVTEVHFKADLTGKPTADPSHYRAEGGLFRVALQR